MIFSVEELKQRIAPVTNKYGIRAVYLFGSYARDEATDASDVDILIPASNEPSAVLARAFGECREGQHPRCLQRGC